MFFEMVRKQGTAENGIFILKDLGWRWRKSLASPLVEGELPDSSEYKENECAEFWKWEGKEMKTVEEYQWKIGGGR